MRTSVLMVLVWLSASQAMAHEFWIEPTQARFDPGETVTADLKVGTNLLGEPYPYLSNRFSAFTVDGEAITGTEGDLPALSFAASSPGLLAAAHQTVAFRTRHDDWQVFLDYLRMEGLRDIETQHRRRRLPETGFAERYTRYARALIQVGEPQRDDTDQPSGMPFELTAEGSPFLPGADSLTVRLTRNGAPVADHQISVYARNGGVIRRLVRTDADGRAEIALAKRGAYLLNAVAMEPVRNGGPVVWHSHWASLAFQI